MDGLDPHPNAQAGPSNFPPVFPAPQSLPRPKQYLHCTQDLLGVFGLLSAYDKHVRPHLRLPSDQDLSTGKGKEKEGVVATPAKDGEEEGETGEKKKKKDNYKHLIKGIPGKHPMKKDQYFQDLLKAPPKQKAHIQLLDQKTLREAFYVSPTGLPTYNKASIEGADPKEKEAKRLKRERRKAEKEERQKQQQAQMSGSAASTPAVTSISTPRAVGTPGPVARNMAGTPLTKPKLLNRPSPHPGSIPGRATPTPTVSTPIVSSTKPSQTNGVIIATPSPVAATAPDQRGVKRELDLQPMFPSQMPTPDSAVSNGQPRPPKKRRLGSGTPQPAPPLPLQQPTPHGT